MSLCQQVVGWLDDLVVRHTMRIRGPHEEALLSQLLFVPHVTARVSLPILLVSYISDEAINGRLVLAPSVGNFRYEVSLQVLRHRKIELVELSNAHAVGGTLHLLLGRIL